MRYKSTSSSSTSHEDSIRSEEERGRLRREWRRIQKLEQEHDKLKKEKITEYEMRRTRVLQLTEQISSKRRRSKSSSRSTESESSGNQRNSTVCASARFNGPEGRKISVADMVSIKVTICNGVPAVATSTEVLRDLIDPADVVIKRRYGEGAKPIFEREELKPPFSADEIEEQRRIVTACGNTDETQHVKRRSVSLSPTRSRTHGLQRSSSHRSRRDESKHRDSGTNYYLGRDSCRKDRSTQRRNKLKDEDDKRPATSRETNEESPRRHEDRRVRERSKERESRNKDRYLSSHRSSKGDRPYRDYRERSSERFHERWRRERSPGSSIVPSHYIEQVPVPIYYGPRPMMVGPLVPYRGQVPIGRPRPAPVMGPVGPFRQRFVPPNMMYRLAPPPNPRFGPYSSY